MGKTTVLALVLTPFLASAQLVQHILDSSQSCPHPHISCSSSIPTDVDTCCLNHPSGHFLLTQFWDASPSLGPSNSWTIHGLWPDLCHGGFDQFCDSSRSQSNVYSLLSSSNASDLLDYMSKYWLSLNGDNNHLWSHEWNKHGTCISTLEPDCYPSSSSDGDLHKDVLDYFTHAASLFSTLDTYSALAASNILPTHSGVYDLDDLQAAISTLQGAEVTFRCHGHELQEIWYHFTVHGPLRDAPPFVNSTLTTDSFVQAVKHKFRAVDPDGSKTNCPDTGIHYLPKEPNQPLPTYTPSTSSSTSTSSPSATSTPFSGKGHLLVRPISTNSSISSSSAGVKGCLIRSGAWYLTSGSSCASYIAKDDPKHLAKSFGFGTSPDAESHLSDPDTSTFLRRLRDTQPLKDFDDEHIFTLSSLYSPCAVIPSAFVSGGGLFICEKSLGIQSIFTSVYDSDDKAYKLAYLDKTNFYADRVPEKFEKVGIYADDKDGEREVQVEILWEGL